MFKTIMVPVDMAHREALGKALGCAGDIARLYGAEIVLVGVTSSSPSATAHNPDEFRARLDAFAAAEAETLEAAVRAVAIVTPDPRADIDDVLLRAVREVDADLVVMASHVPGLMEYVWPSNGGKIAEHAKCSVLVVRS